MATRTILIADEDADTRIILRTMLERHDFAIVDAGGADAAVSEASQRPLDLIILNHPMMCEDGVSLVIRLRSVRALENVPIINLTSRVIPQFIEDAARQGVTITIPKPIDVDNFMDLVRQLTRQSLISAS